MKRKRIFKRKYRTHQSKPILHKHYDFYFNKDSKHYFLSIANDGNKHDGHEMTSHPSLTVAGKPRQKYLQLPTNPDPQSSSNSYVEKRIRKGLLRKYPDGHYRLRLKKSWKLTKRGKKIVYKNDKKYWLGKRKV